MNLPQESLGFRRACFSHASRYSYRHSLLCTVHHSSRYGFCLCTMLLYHCLSSALPSVHRKGDFIPLTESPSVGMFAHKCANAPPARLSRAIRFRFEGIPLELPCLTKALSRCGALGIGAGRFPKGKLAARGGARKGDVVLLAIQKQSRRQAILRFGVTFEPRYIFGA